MRARAGFVIDRFMPYAFAGAAVGRVDIFRSATVSYTRHDIPDSVPPVRRRRRSRRSRTYLRPGNPRREQKRRVRLRIYRRPRLRRALLPNVFLRAEWEYVQFFPGQDFKIHIDTGRVGVAVKF